MRSRGRAGPSFPARLWVLRGRVGAVLALLALGWTARAEATAPHRLSGSAGMFYRRDAGTALGRSYRSLYFDRRMDVGIAGPILGPRLGTYLLSTGVGLLSREGSGPADRVTRGRLDARVQLLPEAPLTLNGFASTGRSDVPASSLEAARSDALGGGFGARLLPGAQSSLDYEDRTDRFAGERDEAKTLRAHHAQSITLGRHALNAAYDFLDRRAESGFADLEYRSKRHTARTDARLALGALGSFGTWFQLDRERGRTVRGNLPDRRLDLLATHGDLTTPLGDRTTLRHSWADQLVRDATGGPARSLRAQIAEQRLDWRLGVRAASDLHTLVRTQWSHVERLEDLWVITALTELAPRQTARFAVIPRAGMNYYAGGVGDGHHAGEALGLALRARSARVSFEVAGSRDRTKGTGLRGRLDGPSYSGFSPRQVGAQLIHSIRTGVAWNAGAFSATGDWEFQDVDNTTLDVRFTTHRLHGSIGWSATSRLRLDLSGDHATTESGSVAFQSDYRSTSGTLSLTARPVNLLELRSRGTYGRVPAGAQESFFSLDHILACRFPQLELSARYLAEKRAPEVSQFDLGRSERLFELRATRSFAGAL